MSDVFISYAHEDTAFVERLRDALAARGRDVWVDTAGIEPGDRWRVSADEAIDRSDALLFVISPNSLRSDPCLGELDHAASLNKRVIPVCVDEAAVEMDKPPLLGELSWIMLRPEDDFQDGVTAIERALDTDLEVVREHTRILVRARAWDLAGRRASPLLRGDELRAAEQWLSRAAVAGSPPTELQQQFIAASRHAATRRLRAVTGVSAAVALVAVALSIYALIQRSNAVHQATLATSRQLAAVSQNNLATNLDVALLLAVKGFRTDANPQTRAALFQADLYSPRLVRFLPMGGPVTALLGSGDRTVVVAGLADGRVMRWELRQRTPQQVARLAASVTSVAVSGDGQVVAAADGSDAVLWRAGATARIGEPTGQGPDVVALSPSGRTLVIHSRVANRFQGPQAISVVDVQRASVSAVHQLPGAGIDPSILVAPSDQELFMLDSGYGLWQRRRIPDWGLELASSGEFGVHQSVPGYSNDGGFFSVSNGAQQIPVWPTSVPTAAFNAPLTAEAPISAPTALTIGPGGGQLAVADSGTIYVAPVQKSPHASYIPPTELTGNGSINDEALRFFGDSEHLLSATGDTVALWDLTQVDRLARVEPTSLQSPCNGCGGAETQVSPDGGRIASVAGDGAYALIQTLADGAHPEVIGPAEFGPPVWDGPTLLVPQIGPSGPPRLPAGVKVWRAVGANNSIVASALSRDQRSVVIVDQQGTTYVEDPDTGALERRIPGPLDLRSPQSLGLTNGGAAIDPADGLVATVDNGSTILTDTATGRVVRRLPGNDADYVAYAGHTLLLQRTAGTLEVWNPRGSVRERVLPGDQSYRVSYPVADAGAKVVARQRSDGTITLADLGSGTTLGTIAAPASASLGLKLGLAFSPDGARLITVVQAIGSNASEIIEHGIGSQALIRAGCDAAGRNLTPGEWRAFVGTAPPSDLTCTRS